MTVTIAIPYFDSAPFIERCVRSALAQTHKDVRVVVVGDGEAPPISFTDPRLVVHTLKRNHRGAPFAQQVALLATPDEWYAPLGSDDWLEPDHIENLLAEEQDAVATGVVFWHSIRRAGGHERDEGIRRVWYETGVFKVERLLAFGGYDASEESGQDNCILWLLEAYGGLRVHGLPPTYHRVKRHYGSISVDVIGTPEREASDARTRAWVAMAKSTDASELRQRRDPTGTLKAELDREVRALRKKIGAMETMPVGGLDALILSSIWDPAGIGATYAAASTDSFRIRSAHKTQTHLKYPVDILWDPSTEAEIRRLALRADVVHLNVRPDPYVQFDLASIKKPAVLEHHGTAFRSETAVLAAQARRYGMVQAVSTIDLLRHGDDLTWLPAPVDLALMARLRRKHYKPGGMVRVVQTPTSRVVKSTEKLEAAVRLLQGEGVLIELTIVEKAPWAESLAAKATADVFFDQVKLGYGNSALEAWGMGIPVIAGGDAWTEERMRSEFGSADLPFYKAEDTVESITAALRALAESGDLREEYGARGLAHVRRFHGFQPALERLAVLYARAMDSASRPVPTPPGPGLFRNTKYPALRLTIDGDNFKFVGGRLHVYDGHRAELVRIHAMASPRSGITEEAW